jgi:hypothetical protein
MAELYDIAEYRTMRDQARREGMTLSEYLSHGKSAGLSHKEMIRAARKERPLSRAILFHRAQSFGRNALLATAGLVAVYAAHYGAVKAIAESKLPPDFHQQVAKVQKLRTEVERLNDAYFTLCERQTCGKATREELALQSSGMGYHWQSQYMHVEIPLAAYELRMQKAKNPLKYLTQ